MKIPLFDVDGTLFKTGGRASKDAFSKAVREVYGVSADLYEINPEGMIDNEVLIEVLKIHGLTKEQVVEKIDLQNETVAEYAKEHKSQMDLEVLPGVREVLQRLRDSNIPAGLLTGNVEGLAWAKMETTGLRDFFGFGAFGSMAFARADLVEIARKNAEIYLQHPVNKKELVIIGDTPKDIKCARDTGIDVIAVATGKYSLEELSEHKPNLLVPNLEHQNGNAVIEFISTGERILEGRRIPLA